MKVAVALLKSADGQKIYLQRRHDRTPHYPGGLSFFGGQFIEGQETPEEAVQRELQEETTLNIGEIGLRHMVSFTGLPELVQQNDPVEVHAFEGIVTDSFDAREGAGLELFTVQEALRQPNMVPTTKHVLEQIVKGM